MRAVTVLLAAPPAPAPTPARAQTTPGDAPARDTARPSARRQVEARLGPRVMRVVVATAAVLALVPVTVVAVGAVGSSLRGAAARSDGSPAATFATAVVVAVVAWVAGTFVGVRIGTLVAWLALRPVLRRDRRRLAAVLDGTTVVQGVGIRPGYGRSRTVELPDGSVVTITQLRDRDGAGRQVGFTRCGPDVDGVGRAAAAMALTAYQVAQGERPWFPQLADGRTPQRWGTFGTTP